MMMEPQPRDATISGPFFVASGPDEDGAAQFFLAASEWCLSQEEISINAPVKGEISLWIRRLYRARIAAPKKRWVRGREALQSAMLKESVAILADPQDKDQTRLAALISSIPSDDLQRISETLRKGDVSALNVVRAEVAEKILPRMRREMNVESIPSALTLVTRMRAARAAGLCYLLHKEHPLTLINRAKDGDRGAVLDLVKIDKLFLHDCCTTRVIREAQLQNDRRFLRQLGKAIAYKPKIGWRRAWQLQLYFLFAGGAKLPSLPILQLRLDPEGRRVGSSAAFRRLVERCRADFKGIRQSAGPKRTPRAEAI